MRFWNAFKNSVWNLVWLREHKRDRAGGWRYFLLFTLLIMVLMIAPALVSVPATLRDFLSSLNQAPAFSATLHKGELAVTGITQPYIITGNDFTIVVDTVATSSLDLKHFLAPTAVGGILVTKDAIEFMNPSTSEDQVRLWKNVADFTLTKEQLVASVKHFTETPYLILGGMLVFAVFFCVLLVSKLWSLIIVVSICFFVASIARRDWKWGELFVVGLFAMTLPSLIVLAASFVGFTFPYLNFLALLAFMLSVVLTRDEGGLIVQPIEGNTR